MKIIAFLLSLIRPDWRLAIFSRARVAIGGHDIVSFYELKKPKMGRPWNTYTYKGVTWWFTSYASKSKFIVSPENYMPAYGGYCSWGMSQGYKAKTSPNIAWTLYEGKLYFNYDTTYKRRWLENKQNSIEKADKNWEVLRHSPAKRITEILLF